MDEQYKEWISEISKRFRKSQIKASMKVNEEMLRFYWELGKELHYKKKVFSYGKSFYKTVSQDLQKELPDVRSFSETNLYYMQYFYEMFPNLNNLPQLVEEFDHNQEKSQICSNRAEFVALQNDNPENLQQLVAEFDSNQKSSIKSPNNTDLLMSQTDNFNNSQQVVTKPVLQGEKIYAIDEIFSIPWGHIRIILDRCKFDQKKALFFVDQVVKNGWSRAVLLNFLDTDLYERQGKAITNFKKTLPPSQSDLAQEITKDPYKFDFLTLRETYNERELKSALLDNVQKFLLELGNGFAFVGREYRIEIGETENFIDMLFYHIRLRCYVVVEVKITEFESSFAGQLGTYVVAVNHELKTEEDGPTLGLLVCKSKDQIKAQYALEASSQPLGVSEYRLSKLVPDHYEGSLPSIDEIENELGKAKG